MAFLLRLSGISIAAGQLKDRWLSNLIMAPESAGKNDQLNGLPNDT
jgi:hypothetical protein